MKEWLTKALRTDWPLLLLFLMMFFWFIVCVSKIQPKPNVIHERFTFELIKSDPQAWVVTDKVTDRSFLAIRNFGIIDLRDRESYKVKP